METDRNDDEKTHINLTPPPPPAKRSGKEPDPKPIPGRPPSESTDQSRDRYGLRRVYAMGGIGQVWIARDDMVGREVALKELRAETVVDRRLWKRFLDEARITGQLEHPGIVPVYELSPPSDDRPPYYVMRFVRGQTLSDATHLYHRSRLNGQAGPLDFLKLVNAFVTVCNTVAYAHSRGVIHRDLKGANIRLGEFGEVITLDWGLAKHVDMPSLQEPATSISMERFFGRTMTLQGQVLGTPAYMAPEQAEGRLDLVNELSDIYGLGAILYEILAGRPPFEGPDTDTILRKVCEGSPPRPGKMNPSVSKSLEAICTKAMARQPADRYPTASDLAKDVQRWLADEPVSAYREPFSARARRWISKHRTMVAGVSAALCVGLLCSLAALLLLSQANARIRKQHDDLVAANAEVQRQRDEAEANLELALGAIDGSYTVVSEDVLLKEAGFQPLRQKLMGRSLEFYRRLEERYIHNPRVRGVRGRALIQQAKLTNEMEGPANALPLIQQARMRFKELADAERTVWSHRRNYAEACLNEGVFLYHLQDYAQASSAFEEALLQYETIARQQADGTTAKQKLGRVFSNLGLLELEWKRHGYEARAEESLEKAVAIATELADLHTNDPVFQADLAVAHLNRGNLYQRFYDNLPEPKSAETALPWLGKAVADCEKARGIWAALAEQDPKDLQVRMLLAKALNNLGGIYRVRSRFVNGEARKAALEKARAFTEECLLVREQLSRENPAVLSFQSELGTAYHNYGNLLVYLENYGEAEKQYKEALRVFADLTRREPKTPSYAIGKAQAMNALGDLMINLSKPEASLDWYKQSMRSLVEAFGEEPKAATVRDAMRMAYWGVAYAYNRLRHYADALPVWNKALALDDDHSKDTELRCGRAKALAANGDYAKAMAEVESLAKASHLRGENWYNLAAAAALASAAVAKDDNLPENERMSKSEEFAKRAVGLLNDTKKSGDWFVGPSISKDLSDDKDLDSLRKRKDFEEFLKQFKE